MSPHHPGGDMALVTSWTILCKPKIRELCIEVLQNICHYKLNQTNEANLFVQRIRLLNIAYRI